MSLDEYTDEELAQELAERHHSEVSEDTIEVKVEDVLYVLGRYTVRFNTIHMNSEVYEESGISDD